jgi:outer membrane murein-binding lipoprotein Lpp
MSKIHEIVKQIGGSDELATQLVGAIQEHVEAEKARLQEEFQARVQKAKQICMEEVAKEKQRLARKVEIFIESKVASVERAAGKTRAVEESAAASKLRQVQQILGEKGGNSVELEALNRKLAKLSEQAGALAEDRDAAVEKAARANAIATRLLRRIQVLESKEAKPADPKPGAPSAETVEQVRVESETPKTTMATASAGTAGNMAAAPVSEPAAPVEALSPDRIAAQMDQVA